MKLAGLAVAMGVGAAAGAVAILAMPKNNAARKLAARAADKVEDAAWKITSKMGRELDF